MKRSKESKDGKIARREQFSSDREFAAVGDDDLAFGRPRRGALGFDFEDDVESREDFPEDNMAAVKPGRFDGTDEELGAVSVGTGIRHGQSTGAGMLELEALVCESAAVNRFSAATIPLRGVAALDHEARNDPMEDAPLVMQTFPALPCPFLPGTKRAEILHRLGRRIAEQSDHHSANSFPCNLHIEVYLVRYVLQTLLLRFLGLRGGRHQ